MSGSSGVWVGRRSGLLGVLASGVLFSLVGCGSSPPPAPAVTPQQSERPQSSSKSAAVPDATAEANSQLPARSVAQEDPPASAQATTIKPERIVLFTPDGPLLVDLVLAIDGLPQQQAVREFAAALIEAVDANHDGKAEWGELQNTEVRSRLAVLGEQTFDDTALKDARRNFDSDGDGMLDPEEALAWLERSADSVAPRMLPRLTGDRAFEPDPRGATTWGVLDADADGLLSTDEIQNAPQRLFGRDANDDLIVAQQEMLGLNDLQRQREQQLGQERTAPVGAAYRAGLFLRTDSDPLDVRSALTLLVPTGIVARSTFAAAAPLFDRLDRDADQALRDEEWRTLATLPPAIRWEVFYRQSVYDQPDQASRSEVNRAPRQAASLESRCELVTPHDVDPAIELQAVTANGFGAQLPRGKVAFVAIDNARDLGAEYQPLLAALANDTDGKLTRAEYQALQSGRGAADFEQFGAGADNALDAEELDAYLRFASARSRLPIGVTVTAGDDPLFGVLDTNGDKRLAEPELAVAVEKLFGLAGQDGVLQPREVPWQMNVTVLRGAAGLNRYMEGPVAGSARPTSAVAPRWFRGADYNGDGVVSRREHVGPASAFLVLDHDNDGFVTLDEALASTAATAPEIYSKAAASDK
ncbi:transaldolase/EF-hand domain-containing protein [Botrimarina hoheduenensis]|uniref:Transaldolase/EF-hand domain-containing protein n=2 Tax=Botrimarina hoheduenensis TaxID=2528000 RepID=A0A5C5WC24_9BACT|nr:transaldolase/EF-hand domain-containing protein [Botrimarina hoheduenensis]